MITQTFICDECKKSVGETELYSIDISISHKDAGPYNTRRVTSIKKDVCKGCLEKRGLIVEKPANGDETAKAEANNKKTLEAKFIDFLEDLGVAFVE